MGFSPEYGARPLKRVVQKEVETPIARRIIEGSIMEGDTIRVAADLDEISLRFDVIKRPPTDEDDEQEGEGKRPADEGAPRVDLKAA